MAQYVERVCVDPADIRRIESLVADLQGNGHVSIVQKDGSVCEGVVSVRPTMQVMRDQSGREGINAELRLERPREPAWSRRIWLDQIERVEHLDSILGSES
ncbi:DUF3247 family protein [Rhodanobacter glycinis]|uniref:DUF3247 family protein n=1 Tax=Rhodanobacter glycinis TaxID=582702 RepID=A0A5B9E082_9GAMM|nr:DUF3247 family protein [Rhodanobacter glycinis]QEE23617.1 DUF3247 family protein [Rhodanobacter glycinis]